MLSLGTSLQIARGFMVLSMCCMLECLRIEFLDTHVKFTQPQIRLSACTSFMLRGSASRLRHRPKQMGYMKAHSAWRKITVSCIVASTHNENANDNNGRRGFSRNVTSANQQRALISTCFIPVHVLRCSLSLSLARPPTCEYRGCAYSTLLLMPGLPAAAWHSQSLALLSHCREKFCTHDRPSD